MTHRYQTTDTDTNASLCRQELMKLQRWWNIVGILFEKGHRVFTGKAAEDKINLHAGESRKNLNFE